MSCNHLIFLVLLIVAYALCCVVVALNRLTSVLDTHTRHMQELSRLAWDKDN